jgi:hypothetical protein
MPSAQPRAAGSGQRPAWNGPGPRQIAPNLALRDIWVSGLSGRCSFEQPPAARHRRPAPSAHGPG